MEQVIKETFEEETPKRPVEVVSTGESIYAEQRESVLISEPTEFVLESTPFLANVKPKKRKGCFLWLLIILLVAGGIGSGLYYFYPPAKDFTETSFTNFKNTINKISKNISISDMINSVSKWFAPAPKPVPTAVTVVIPKDTSDVNQKQLNDSLQIMFDNSRIYKEFIATERLKEGSWLARLSRKYFKSKYFWVYIYEANKEKIRNPDIIRTGTLIRIPKLDLRLIDVSNPRCIEKAEELHDLYVKKKTL